MTLKFNEMVIAGLALIAALRPQAGIAEDLPWAFYGPEAEGYSVELVSIDPLPGTPVVRGSEVTIVASINYKLSIAAKGRVEFVPQDEKNRPIGANEARAKRSVEAPSGAVTLRQTLVVPSNAKEIRLFIPLLPDGLASTTGEITVRYPIVKKLKAAN